MAARAGRCVASYQGLLAFSRSEPQHLNHAIAALSAVSLALPLSPIRKRRQSIPPTMNCLQPSLLSGLDSDATPMILSNAILEGLNVFETRMISRPRDGRMAEADVTSLQHIAKSLGLLGLKVRYALTASQNNGHC